MHRLYAYMIAVMFLVPGSICSGQQDQRANPYLQAVSDQFDMTEGYLIHIDYIRRDIMRETSAEGEGTIWMKGFKYKMEVNEFIVYFDGETQYSQNTDAEEVYVSTPDPDQPGYLQAVPIRIIKSYGDFKYQLMGDNAIHGKRADRGPALSQGANWPLLLVEAVYQSPYPETGGDPVEAQGRDRICHHHPGHQRKPAAGRQHF